MSFIDKIFRRKSIESDELTTGIDIDDKSTPPGENLIKVRSDADSPEIPEHIFVEYKHPNLKRMDTIEPQKEAHDLHAIYRLLEQNLEKKGYEDALMNPDTNYMNENIQYIQNETALLISRVKTYYGSHLRTIDFHIETRKRNGMVETVDELLAHRKSVEEDIITVLAIEQELGTNAGRCQNIVLGYKKGFMNGFAAITYNYVLGRKAQ